MGMNSKVFLCRIILAFVFIFLGVFSRLNLRFLLPQGNEFIMFDMFAAVAVFAILAGTFIGGFFSAFVPLMILLISDIVYGNNYIFLFTYSGFAIIGLLGCNLKNKLQYPKKFVLNFTGTGILGVVVYDLWTNFGWWLGPYYPHTLEGLILCYTMAIPFTLGHLVSTAIVLPLVSIPTLYFYNFYKNIFLYRIPSFQGIKEHYTTICAVIMLCIIAYFRPFITL